MLILAIFANLVTKRARDLELYLVTIGIKGLTTAELLISVHPTAVHYIDAAIEV